MFKLLSNLPTLLKLSYRDWKEDGASRLAAALAYYTIFSLAPLLVLVIAITGLIWQADVVRTLLLNQIQGLVGTQGADFIEGLIAAKGTPAQGIFATVVGVITLVLGALGVFGALHDSLNIIWNIKEEESKSLLETIRKVILNRLLSFTMILGIGFLLLVSLVVSTALSAVQGGIGNLVPLPELILQAVNLLISIGVITVLFAFIFKFLPDAKIAWRDVWLGAFGTAILFSLGKTAIGFYLGNSNVASSYGAAGSLVVMLLWIYYSAQILFFGAEFTQVYANKYGSRIVPEAHAKVNGPKSSEKSDTKESRGRRARTTIGVSSDGNEYFQENRQTVQYLLGAIAASFITGVLATILGIKKT